MNLEVLKVNLLEEDWFKKHIVVIVVKEVAKKVIISDDVVVTSQLLKEKQIPSYENFDVVFFVSYKRI